MTDFKILKSEDKRLVFGCASVSITVDGELLQDLQADSIAPDDLETAAYEDERRVELITNGGGRFCADFAPTGSGNTRPVEKDVIRYMKQWGEHNLPDCTD